MVASAARAPQGGRLCSFVFAPLFKTACSQIVEHGLRSTDERDDDLPRTKTNMGPAKSRPPCERSESPLRRNSTMAMIWNTFAVPAGGDDRNRPSLPPETMNCEHGLFAARPAHRAMSVAATRILSVRSELPKSACGRGSIHRQETNEDEPAKTGQRRSATGRCPQPVQSCPEAGRWSTASLVRCRLRRDADWNVGDAAIAGRPEIGRDRALVEPADEHDRLDAPATWLAGGGTSRSISARARPSETAKHLVWQVKAAVPQGKTPIVEVGGRTLAGPPVIRDERCAQVIVGHAVADALDEARTASSRCS